MMSEWNSNMDEAPRDGSGILAYNSVAGVYSTAFTTKWDAHVESYEGFPCGFWPAGVDSCPFGMWDCQPTHWQPLPSPPETTP